MRVGRLGAAHQLLGHHGDGRERRAEPVRRRRGQAVERRQFLLARQHHLGRGQGLGHAPRLLRRAPRVEADEQDAGHHRRPHPHHVGEREQQVGMMEPRQRVMKAGEHRRRGDGERAERRGDPERQRRGRDGDRRDQQEGERVLQAAGQIEQGGELEDVVSRA